MRRTAAVLLTLVVALGSCSSPADENTLLVMAAASLTDAFAEIEDAFEAANPAVDVRLNLAGSSSLREQILQGAPAGVFASANQQTMQVVVAAGEASDAQIFATNELVVAVPSGNPAGVAALSDLEDESLLVGVCARGVPCGDFAAEALEQLGVVPSVDTNESDVRSLLTKLEAAELDAGIVYRTDVAASDRVEALDLLRPAAIEITYPVAVLTGAGDSEQARSFVEFVLSPEGRAILESHGFGTP